MTRREVFSRLCKTGAAIAAAPFVKLLPTPKPAPLALHPDAFAFVMAPLKLDVSIAARNLRDEWDKRCGEAVYREFYGRN